MERNSIDNARSSVRVAHQLMAMVPESQKKWQFGTLIYEINFLIGCLLVYNMADPVLPKKKKIKAHMNYIAPLATVESDYVNGRKRWAQPVE